MTESSSCHTLPCYVASADVEQYTVLVTCSWFIRAHNNHVERHKLLYRISCMTTCTVNYNAGKGIPNERQIQRYGATPLPPHFLPLREVARQMYLEQGGDLTAFSVYGMDPLRNRQDLMLRRHGLFQERNPSWEQLFSNVITGDGKMLKDAILNFLHITKAFEQLL